MFIVSKGIVELHGGSISVTSEGIGKGSCFSVEIPIVSNQAYQIVRDSVATVNASEIQYRNYSTTCNTLSNLFCRSILCQFRLTFNSNSSESFLGYVSKNIPKGAKVNPFHEVSPSHSFAPTDPKITTSLRRHLSERYVNKVEEPDSKEPLVNLAQVCAVRDGINEKEEDDYVTPRIKLSNFRRVLIVDDVAMNRKMLKRLLVTRFEECDEAEDGQQAVDMVKESLASGVNYDVITMDYQMPVMDGVTATSNIRRLGYKGQIIAVTGNALSEDLNAFLSNGANIVLTKPLSITAFDKYMNTLN